MAFEILRQKLSKFKPVSEPSVVVHKKLSSAQIDKIKSNAETVYQHWLPIIGQEFAAQHRERYLSREMAGVTC